MKFGIGFFATPNTMPPTDLAIAKADEAGITLVALARSDGHAVFAGGERLIEAQAELV